MPLGIVPPRRPPSHRPNCQPRTPHSAPGMRRSRGRATVLDRIPQGVLWLRETHSLSATQNVHPSGRLMEILIAEDQPTAALFLSRTLEKLGHHVAIARD